LGEIDYYYKQSLGLLGFAAITGQFPNVLEDMKGNVIPAGIAHPKARNGAAGPAAYVAPLAGQEGVAKGRLWFAWPTSADGLSKVPSDLRSALFSADGRGAPAPR
jgi:hypothetical protein